MTGKQYRAVVTLYNLAGAVVARAGETCERVTSDLSALEAAGLVTRIVAPVPASTRKLVNRIVTRPAVEED